MNIARNAFHEGEAFHLGHAVEAVVGDGDSVLEDIAQNQSPLCFAMYA